MKDDSAGDDVSRLKTEKKERSCGRAFGLALALTTALAAVSTLSYPALAQSPASVAARTNFNIPPQPLAQALVQFSNATGIQLFFNADVTRGINSAGAQGSLARTEALGRILAGSGLSYKFTNASTVAIQRPGGTTSAAVTVPGAISLDTINVQGDQQSAYGPGVGYLATRSAAGTKTDTPIIETPQSISVVTRKQMDDQQPQTVYQALRYTPGIVPESLGVSSSLSLLPPTSGITLRGFQPDIYLDGLNDNNGAVVDPYLLNRIEVLNGPASVLYGQASPGGFINMESKLPTETPLHEVQVGLGNFGQYRGAFDLGGPLDQNGQFLYRLTGVGLTEDSQVNFTKTQEIAIAPAFTWRPDANTSFTLLGKYQNYPNIGTYAGQIPAIGSVLPNPNGRVPTNFFAGDPNYNTANSTLASVGYQFEHKFNDTWSIKQDFLYQHEKIKLAAIFPFSLEPDNRTLDRDAYYFDGLNNNVLLDTQANARFSTWSLQHVLTFGVDYQHVDTDDYDGQDYTYPSIDIFDPVYFLPPEPAGTFPKTRQAGTTDQIGIYSQDQITFGHWHFLMGARGDYATQTESTTRLATDAVLAHFNYTSLAPSWRVGAVYLFDNGLAPYVSYTTSFQPNTGANYAGAPLQPTTAEQYEAGIKYQPPGWNSFVTAAVYNLTEQNVLTTDFVHPGFSTQTGEVRSRGVELSGHANLTDNLSLIAAYTYTNAINTQSNATDTTINGVTESEQGKWPVAVPAQMASLWADYTFHEGPARGFGLSGGVRYIGPSWGDDVNSFRVPGFTLFDAALHYDLGKVNTDLKGLKLQVNVTNLFDKTYVASCGGTTACYYGPRRTVYATLTYDW